MGIIIGFIGAVSWMYTITGIAGAAGAGIPLGSLPQWWYNAAGIAAITVILVICLCIADVRGSKRQPKRDPRRLGVVRYVNGKWIAVQDEEPER